MRPGVRSILLQGQQQLAVFDGMSVVIIGLTTPYSDDTPTVIGTYYDGGGPENGITIHIFLDDVEDGTAVTDASGNWSYTFATPLPDGVYTITAEAGVDVVSEPFILTIAEDSLLIMSTTLLAA